MFPDSRVDIVEVMHHKVELRSDDSGKPGIRELGVQEGADIRACRGLDSLNPGFR